MSTVPPEAKRKRSGFGLGVLVGVIIGLPVGCVGALTGRSPAPSETQATKEPSTPTASPAATPTEASAADTPATVASTWSYSRVQDEMNGDGVIACTDSTDEVHLEPPYQDVKAQLCIRRMPKSGLSTFVRLLGEGQFMCQSYESCRVRLKYGQGAAHAVSAREPSDNSSNFVFLEGAAAVLAGVQKAGTTLFEANYYQAGEQTVHFPTAGLQWPPPAGALKD